MPVQNNVITRDHLAAHLNEDLAGEYQAIIGYVVYSQVIKGAQYMNIAKELEAHAGENQDGGRHRDAWPKPVPVPNPAARPCRRRPRP